MVSRLPQMAWLAALAGLAGLAGLAWLNGTLKWMLKIDDMGMPAKICVGQRDA